MLQLKIHVYSVYANHNFEKYKLFLLYSKNKLKDLKQKLPSNIYSMIHQGFPFFIK